MPAKTNTKKVTKKKVSKKKAKKKVAKKEHRPTPAEAPATLSELTPEQLLESAAAYHSEYVDICLNKAIPELKGLLELLDKAIPCLQFQRAIMDVESAREHLQNLKDEGPAERHRELPLDESDVEEEFQFEDTELEYAEETEQADEENQDEEQSN